MASIKEFENNLSTLTDYELEAYEKALGVLKNWEIFEKNFGHSSWNNSRDRYNHISLAQLRVLVGYETTRRLMEKL